MLEQVLLASLADVAVGDDLALALRRARGPDPARARAPHPG